MKQKGNLHTNRIGHDKSRPAVFLDNTEKKLRLDKQSRAKQKHSQK